MYNDEEYFEELDNKNYKNIEKILIPKDIK
jgi:hypothetical protein